MACFIEADIFQDTWWHMFIARFFLGFGIGPKSATTPIFAAECSPPKLRGALTMQWQMWTAFGIMIGYVADLAFYFVSVKLLLRDFRHRRDGRWIDPPDFQNVIRTNRKYRSPTMGYRLA